MMQSVTTKVRSRGCLSPSCASAPASEGADARFTFPCAASVQLRKGHVSASARLTCSASTPLNPSPVIVTGCIPTRALRLQPIHAQPPTSLGLFPAGKKQGVVQLPALMLFVDVTQMGVESTLTEVVEVVSAGATAVVLTDESGNAGALYEAACKLKEAIRGRSMLFVVDRTDIAQAAEADGVLMTNQGVSTVVAKRMIGDSRCLVGRIVTSADDAITAAADGANLVMVMGDKGAAPQASVLIDALSKQRSGNAIPVLMGASAPGTNASQLAAAAGWSDVAAEATPIDGTCVTLGLLAEAGTAAAPEPLKTLPRSRAQDVRMLLDRLSGKLASAGNSGAEQPGSARGGAGRFPAGSAGLANMSWVRRLLTTEREDLLADEKTELGRVVDFLQELVPDLQELGLLRDAVKQLDDLFLMVVVGEFNSGKSSMINALLGNKFVAEGILPTTNEISILKYGEKAENSRQADGLFVRRLPAELLQEISIVDTPGTNVILDRQQRLTEEYVPRADMVVFVMSADRPFSESEVKFLEYIRQWRKKVVFVINKADMLGSVDEVDAVKTFVIENAKRLLKLDSPNVIAVSSRAALGAKLAATKDANTAGLLDSIEEEELINNPAWNSSGFADFENFVYNYLIGGGGEGARLKLQTPLNIADALLAAAGTKLAADLEAAESELRAVQMVAGQLEKFRGAMVKDAAAQREVVNKAVSDATARWTQLIDKTLQVSNLASVSNYVMGSGASAPSLPLKEGESACKAAAEAARMVTEDHTAWLATNCNNQVMYYASFCEERRKALQEVGASVSDAPSVSQPTPATSSSTSMASLMDAKAMSLALDEELRETVVRTTATAAGGPAAAIVLDAIINNAFEETLILVIAGMASYVSVLNLPLRRAEIKKSLALKMGSFVEAVQKDMERELDEQVDITINYITSLVEPIERDCAAELARLQGREATRAALEQRIQDLIRRTADVE